MSEHEHGRDTQESRETRQFERLVFFSDAVFAIAITLLVLDLKPPPGPFNADMLKAMIPNFEGFGISFFVIGIYWLAHHQLFRGLRREDGALRVMNLVFLAGIAFLPFPTSVIARYDSTTGTVIFYALSVAAVGLLQFGLVLVARRPVLMAPRESVGANRRIAIRTLVAPCVFLASVGLAFVSPRLATYSWILIWPAHRLMDWRPAKRVSTPSA